MKAVVYWLHLPRHKNPLKQGYIGVSINIKQRQAKHLTEIRNNKHHNPHLTSAYKKYGEENIIRSVLLVGLEDYCYKIEKQLRPQKEIGWNIAEGGHKPPNCKGRVSPFKGHKHTKKEVRR